MTGRDWLVAALVLACVLAIIGARTAGLMMDVLPALKARVPKNHLIIVGVLVWAYAAALIMYGFSTGDWLVVAVFGVPWVINRVVQYAVGVNAKAAVKP